MKNFCCLIGSIFWSVCAQAAVVTLGTPGGSESEYTVGGQSYDVFADIVTSDAAFGSNAGDEELIWLGVHESWAGSATNVTQASNIVVNVTNQNAGVATKGVSLVLSSAAQVSWFVNFDAGVQLNNIFIISLGSEAHTVRVNSAQDGFAPGDDNPLLGGVHILRSNTELDCGYQLPTPNPAQGCNTEVTLGMQANAEFEMQNVLANMQPGDTDSKLKLTSFNGSYYVNQFDVSIDSVAAVIPIPASALLFGSSLFALAGLRRRAGAAPRIIN